MNERKSTIFFAVTALPPPVHGQSAATAALLQSLQSQKIKIGICDVSPRSLNRRQPSYHFRRLMGYVAALGRILKGSYKNSLLVYTVYEAGNGFLYTYLLAAWVRLLGGELILHHHTAAQLKSRSSKFDKLLRVAPQSTLHVVLSEGMKKDLSSLYLVDHSSIFVLPNFALLDMDAPRASRVSTLQLGVHIGMLSNLCVDKGSESIPELIDELAAKGIVWKLTVAGPITDGTTRAIIDQVGKKYPGSFNYIGPIDKDKKQQFFSEIDLFFFPSKYKNEAQPLVVLEALKSGVPVAAANMGYVQELLRGTDFVCEEQALLVEKTVEFCGRLNVEAHVQRDIALAAFEDLVGAGRSALNKFCLEIKKITISDSLEY